MLQTVVSQSLPEVRPAAFLDLVDGGEGNEEAQGPRKMSSTPLRMCRYAGGADGVAFGELQTACPMRWKGKEGTVYVFWYSPRATSLFSCVEMMSDSRR